MEVVDNQVVCGYKGRRDRTRINPLKQNILEVPTYPYTPIRGCTAETPAQQTRCLLHLVTYDPDA